MSFKHARSLLHEFSNEVNALKKRAEELEQEILTKSETLARLERAKRAPVSDTAAIVRHRISLQGIKLKPTETRVSNENAFPEIEKESLEASEIKPWLYLAGNIVARDAAMIRVKGITRIINAAHTVCPNYFEKEFEYTSFDLIDHPSETIDHFILNAIAEIERAREDNAKILVHCHQGISRSASLVIAYVAWKDSVSIMDALMYVKARRKIVSPNAGFLEQLNQFEKRLKNTDIEPLLYYVTNHSEEQPLTLVVKQVYDKTRPLIDEDEVFLLYEGQGGDVLIRAPKQLVNAKRMQVADQVAGWMVKYEQAFRSSKVVHVPSDSERFIHALERLPNLDSRGHLVMTED